MSEALVNLFLGRLNYLQMQYPQVFAALEAQFLQLKKTLNKIRSFIKHVDKAMYMCGDNSAVQWLRATIYEAVHCVEEMSTPDGSSKAPHYKIQLENINACLSSVLSFRPQFDDGVQQYSSGSLISKYVSLPDYLRSCLMYICTLPESYRLRKGRLVRLWVAEGLVQEKPGQVVEDIAEEYLEQLVSLGMVETLQDYLCHFEYKLPHSFHDFLLSEMEKTDFVIADSYLQPHIYPHVHRVLVYKFANEAMVRLNNPLIRSLFTFGLNIDPFDIWPYSWFKLLKVLNLEGLEMKKVGDGVGNLRHLRSLSFRGSELEELPEGISNLCELQTLDIRWCPNISSLPDWILKNGRLRNLLMSNNRTSGIKLLPIGMERLKNLRSLKGVNAGSYTIARDLIFFTQIRELELCNFSEDYSTQLSTSIMQMKGLVSLNLRNHNFLEDDLLPAMDHFSPPPLLRKLWLKGRLASLPDWISSARNLTKLRLWYSHLFENPTSSLQFLPNLKHLTLFKAYKAKRIGKEFCQAGGFPKLEALVYASDNLVEWTEIEPGSFPCLKYLRFHGCRRLMFLPEGLQYVTTLKELNLRPLQHDHARRLLPREGKENYKIKHIPKVDYFLES